LPLPATPLRRTERKRDPQPPLLIGKIRWGRRRVLSLPDGRKIPYEDWNLDPNDVHRLLRYARARLGIRYRAQPIDLESFSFDPLRVPILYVNGVRPFSLTPQIRAKLKAYLLAGGFFLADACRGSQQFADSIRHELAVVFPRRRLEVLPPDHPIFSSWRTIRHVRYSPAVTDRPGGEPYLEGLSLGCRTVAVLSPYGMSCSWDSDHVVPGSRIVVGESAKALGLNIIAYALGTFELGRFYAHGGLKEPVLKTPAAFSLRTGGATGGEFVFAQVLHNGRADPDPTAFARLLENLMSSTAIGVKLRRRLVAPDDPHLGDYPFLYMTGHGHFSFSEAQRSRLRAYLEAGGFLFADSCCGNLSFDQSFRNELQAVLPGRKLRVLGPGHPIFHCLYDLTEVKLTPRARAAFPDMHSPYLEGVEINGSLRVVYSVLDVGNGWEGVPHPFARGYEASFARKLGVNIIVYAMTH